LIEAPPYYVRGHLLNENVGGKGQILNLTPITTKANAGHKTSVETSVKTWVAKNQVVYYSVKADYAGRPASMKQEQKDLEDELKTAGKLSPKKAARLTALEAERYLCRKIVFKAWVLKRTQSDTWVEDKAAKDPFKEDLRLGCQHVLSGYGDETSRYVCHADLQSATLRAACGRVLPAAGLPER
jgi:DNA/RNA non-specific endonuclease